MAYVMYDIRDYIVRLEKLGASFWSLATAQCFSMSGDRVIGLRLAALTLTSYNGSDGRLGAFISALQLAPALLFSPLAGIISDIFPRKHLFQCVLLIKIVISISFLPIFYSYPLIGLFYLALVYGTAGAFFHTVKRSWLPGIVSVENIAISNEFFLLSDVIGIAFGLVVGVLLGKWLSNPSVLAA